MNDVPTFRTGIEYRTAFAERNTKSVKKRLQQEGVIGLRPNRQGHRQRPANLRRGDAPSGSTTDRPSARGYFSRISDSTPSYGSYSGAVPNETITWGKLTGSTPKFIIESDATIVAPLIFSRVLG